MIDCGCPPRWRQLDGHGWGIAHTSDEYPWGTLIWSGDQWPVYDAWFREGAGPTPVESATWGRIKGMFHDVDE